jgi:hypothetical protein
VRPLLTASVLACCVLAVAPASTAAASPKLSIKAGSKLIPYTGAVTLSGRLSSERRGVRVVLRADRFPFHGSRAVASATTGEDGSYRFKRKPTLGTRYRVVLRRNPAIGSQQVTVYVASLGRFVSCDYCGESPKSPGEHTFRLTLDVVSPRRIEVGPVYFYWGQVNGKQERPPEVLRVKTVHGKRLTRRKVRIKVSYRFTLPDGPYGYAFNICGRDHFARNGLGLPGHHHCGDGKIAYPAYTKYLG